MKVFISWSGDMSHKLALVLRDWLCDVLQAVEPWVSSEDIAKGALWLPEVTDALKNSQFGVCCLTPENVSSPWMAFEAGAMVAHHGATRERVSPILLSLSPSDAIGPYATLQHTQIRVDEFEKLLLSINAVSERPIDEERVRKSVHRNWSEFEEKARGIARGVRPGDAAKAKRSEKEILNEVLELTRSQGAQMAQLLAAIASRGGALSSLSAFTGSLSSPAYYQTGEQLSVSPLLLGALKARAHIRPTLTANLSDSKVALDTSGNVVLTIPPGSLSLQSGDTPAVQAPSSAGVAGTIAPGAENTSPSAEGGKSK